MANWTADQSKAGEPGKNGKGEDLLIITVCKVKRHRSIAVRELIYQYLDYRTERLGISCNMADMDHSHWSNLCKSDCPECNWKTDEAWETAEEAQCVFERRMRRKLGKRTLLSLIHI